MFKSLREKLSGWFRKEEKQDEEKPKQIEKQKQETEEPKEIKKTDEKKQIQKESSEAAAKEVGEKRSFWNKLGFRKEKPKEEKEERKEATESEIIKESREEKQELKEEETEKKEATGEEIKEVEEKTEKEENFFSKLINKISHSELKKEDFEELFAEFEIVLLENNVALEVVDKIKETLSSELVGKKFNKKEAKDKILGALRKSILDVLYEPPNLLELVKKKEGVFVILFFGINGSGKTTSIAKLAYLLKKEGISCVLAAADTFRAASIEQLEEHAKRLDVPIIKGVYGRDPASVGFDAIQYARKNNKKVVLIDTAGRMYTRANLMKEMEKIVKISKPDLKIFVGESITGNDATEQAKMFNETAGIDGIILTKADVDEKAGTILSASYVTKKPIFYLGVGQEYSDLKDFRKEEVLAGLGLDK